MARVCWIRGNPPAELAIVLCPHGEDWLAGELLDIRRGGVETLVSLLEPDEAAWMGLSEEEPLARHTGLSFIQFPIRDATVPSDAAGFRGLVAELAERLRGGEHIGVHCRGCIGRATITAACTLVHLGWRPMDALEAIAAARGCAVPDTREQLEWILRYEAQPSAERLQP